MEIPTNPELLFNYACANERLGNYRVAIQFFQFAYDVRPDWSDALYGLAIAHFKLCEYKKACKLIKQTIKIYMINKEKMKEPSE